MAGRLIALVVGAFAVLGIPAAVGQMAISDVAELIENPRQYAGNTVTVEGELIGDYGFRASGWMWTQLNDDSYARAPVVEGGELTGSNVGIGLRIPEALAADLDPPGGYRLRGPLVRATGIYRFHDVERQGETFIEVTALTVVEPGRVIDEGPDVPAMIAGAALLVVAGLLHLSYRRRMYRA